eukprot:GFUD01122375.1.p1 GENE.GFUD01122375.1~~GFUD01122375.1.p1  ORF type:complete len:383 (+),score=135.88 GFUD01122375.1:77-1225(+)
MEALLTAGDENFHAVESEAGSSNVIKTDSSPSPVSSSASNSPLLQEVVSAGITPASCDIDECTATVELGRGVLPRHVSSLLGPGHSVISTSVTPLKSDLDDSDSDIDVSPESRKFIEPDAGSINKLLNFDNESDESCDDLLDDVCDYSDSHDIAPPQSQSDDNTTPAPASHRPEVLYQPNIDQMHSSLQEELNSSWSEVSSSLAMANLSLEEVGHIRSVHARADIESLPYDGTTKRDVLEGKICFQCMKTKFGLFCRSKKCPLCSQSVCSRCVAKISATPFQLLPGTSLTSQGKQVVSSSFTLPRQRSASTTTSSRNSSTGSLRRSSGSMSSNQGSVLSVCLDCREMVVQIIRSAETARKVQAARSVMLASLVRREADIGQE